MGASLRLAIAVFLLAPLTAAPAATESRRPAAHGVQPCLESWSDSSARQAAGPAPVWQVKLTPNDSIPGAVVAINNFGNAGYRHAFPLRALPVTRFVSSSIGYGDHVSLTFSTTKTRLEIEPDGRLRSGFLSFDSTVSFSVNTWTGRMTALALVHPDSSMAGAVSPESTGTFEVASDAFEPGRALQWEESPNGGWAVILTSAGATVVRRDRSRPMHQLDDRVYYGCFSKDGTRYAAVAEEGSWARPGALRRWIALSDSGGIVYEGAPTNSSLDQLYLSPDGAVLSFLRQSRGGTAEAVVVDLKSGVERTLPRAAVPDGVRYYSSDGKTMLVLKGYPGHLSLFDLKNPLRPVALCAPLKTADAYFITGAVSSDGSLVAVEVVDPDDPTHASMRVMAFDRDLKQRAVISPRTNLSGLQFEGRFLFLGVQRNPIPDYLNTGSTMGIELYDLAGL